MVKSKTKQNKTAKLEAYRKYRNKIIDLLKISRQSYYKIFFEQSKNNSKLFWQGINNMIYSKKNKKSIIPSSLIADGKNITHPQDMAKHFNNFFTSVGKEIQDNIPPTKSIFKNYLKTQITSLNFLQLQKKSVTLFKH